MCEIELPTLKCKRCGHSWHPNRPKLPKVCPACCSPYWNKEYSRADLVKKKVDEKKIFFLI